MHLYLYVYVYEYEYVDPLFGGSTKKGETDKYSVVQKSVTHFQNLI